MAPALPRRRFLVLLSLGCAAVWGASALVVVPVGARAVAGDAVLRPGLHAGLPWPFGGVRWVEFGRLRDLGLAEAPYLVACAGGPGRGSGVIAGDGVRSVNVALHVLYRVGLTDRDAALAAGGGDAPALVRAAAGSVATAYFAQSAMDAAMGGSRAALETGLRTQLQAWLDADGAGLEVVAVVVASLHPPEGAALAYEAVRAAGISAAALVGEAHGAAASGSARRRQDSYGRIAGARAAAAEIVDGARAGLVRFTADQAAAHAGGTAFLLERYFASLVGALAKAPKTIVDHRLNWPEAPVLDLRPLSAAAGATGKED